MMGATSGLGFTSRPFCATYRAEWQGCVAILAPGDIPTVDFYVTPRLDATVRTLRFDSRVWHEAALHLPPGTQIIIVRHAARRWLRFIAAEAARWSGVAFLMDDDLPAAWRCRELPLDYRIRTSARFAHIADLLMRVCDRLWVSTDTLQRRYCRWDARTLPPLHPFPPRAAAPAGCRRWCYHGTRAHQREMRWLRPVIAEVQARVPEAVFEIMGGAHARRLLAGIPRVEVLPPLSWPDYRRHCDRAQIAVGVAPLLPGHFNAARAHVKAFDIAHCGAVGLFARRTPYAPALDGSGAVFGDDDAEAWSNEVVALLTDDTARQRRYQRMAQWLDETRRAAMNSPVGGLRA
jgi:hypothetical protein